MTLAVWQRNITDGNTGAVLPSALVEVRLESTGNLAPIYEDRDGLVPHANPITADADGFVRFYAEAGAYKITATSGSTQRILRHVAIGKAAERDYLDDGSLDEVPEAEPLDSSFVLGALADGTIRKFRVDELTGAVLSGFMTEGPYSDGAVPFGYVTGELTQDPTNLFFEHDKNRFRVGSIHIWSKGHQDSTFIGRDAGAANNTPSASNGINNTFIGSQAGKVNTSGYANLFVGYNAGGANTTGLTNTFLGYQAGFQNTIGNFNVFIGTDAGGGNLVGDGSVIIGFHAGLNLAPADDTGYSVIIGHEASITASTAVNNVFIGNRVGFNNTTGSRNVMIGDLTGFTHNTADECTLIGREAGFSLTTGDTNTMVGYRAGFSGSQTNGSCVFLGAFAGYYETASSKFFVDNQDRTNEATARTSSLMYGVFNSTPASQTLALNAQVSVLGSVTARNATAIPAGGTAGVGFMFSSATNFGIFFGSGAPSLSAAQGSLYLRSDGSSTSTRMYVNTNGSTGWTNVTTAA